jgi:hypothetical protein
MNDVLIYNTLYSQVLKKKSQQKIKLFILLLYIIWYLKD